MITAAHALITAPFIQLLLILLVASTIVLALTQRN